MRTCTVCGKTAPDLSTACLRCGSEFAIFSATSVALRELTANPRVLRIRLMVSADACPACQMIAGEFAKGLVPLLPVVGCSHPLGCRCFYGPALETIYP